MADDYLVRIGKLIRDARQHRGWTQAQLAEALGTSQSAVNRIERGNQNISLEMIARIGEALESEIVSLGYAGPMHLRVVGGRRLSGAIDVKTSKNACVALLCASLLNKGRTVLRRVARIEEVYRLLEVLNSIGVRTRWINDGNDLEIVPPAELDLAAIDADAAVRTRSIIMFLGPLLHRMDRFKLPYAGGCDLGTRTIEPRIDVDVDYSPSEDPVEAMSLLAAAVVTESELTVRRVPIEFLEIELAVLEEMGLDHGRTPEYCADNGRTRLVDLTVRPSKLEAPIDKIHPMPFPGLNIDNVPFFAAIAAVAQGQTLIHDWVYDNRAIYLTDLNRLGGRLQLLDPHRVLVEGPTRWRAAEMMCPPALRPAVVVLLAMMAAEGKSVLRNVYVINRGYEDLAERLNAVGARIEIFRDI